MTSEQRNLRKVIVDEGCWWWKGEHSPKGYSVVYLSGHKKRAHRWLYELLVGPVSEGLQLDHLCRNRGCVNPAHLEPVTSRENTRRGLVLKCKHGEDAKRYANGNCAKCSSAYKVGKPDKRNKQKRAQYMREWRASKKTKGVVLTR